MDLEVPAGRKRARVANCSRAFRAHPAPVNPNAYRLTPPHRGKIFFDIYWAPLIGERDEKSTKLNSNLVSCQPESGWHQTSVRI